jgi:hypothetical protein
MHCNCETSDGWSARKIGSSCFWKLLRQFTFAIAQATSDSIQF